MANFQKVTVAPDEMDLNTGVSSYMRMGQILDMQNKHPQAVDYYKKAIAFAPEAEAAKESRRYMSSMYRRK